MKKLTSLILALLMLFSLAACAGTDKGAPATDSAAATTAPAETSDSGAFDVSKYDGVDFEIMWQETDATQIDIVTNFAQAAVAAAFPNVNITWTGNVDTDVSTLAQTGELADVWFGSTTLEMINSGIILDLTDYLTADTYLTDNYSNPDFYYFRDHIWALGTGVDNFYTGTMYYNQDILDELKIAPITNYDELFAACGKILEAGYLPFTIDGGGANSCFDRFLFQNLIISVDPENYVSIMDGGDINTTGTTQAMQLIADMRDAGYLGTGTSVKTTSESIGSFVEGQAAILYTDSWNNGSVAEATFPITVSWWPTANAEFKTGEYVANWGSPLSGWNANGATEYPELAVEIIKTIVKAEAARHLAAGLTTNFIQDGAAVPANGIEEQRAAIYAEVGTWYKGFMQNSIDGATSTEFCNQCATLLSDDKVPVADFMTALSAAWSTNTFFD